MSATTAPDGAANTTKSILALVAAAAVCLVVIAGITGKRGENITPSSYVTTGGANLAPQVQSNYPANNQR